MQAHDVMALRCRGPNTTLNFLLATYNGIAAVLTRIEPVRAAVAQHQ
jgi:hypothetical protein